MHAFAFALAAGALGVAAQTTTSASTSQDTPMATILAGTSALTTGLVASVIGVDSCETTYQLICTDAEVCSSTSQTVRPRKTPIPDPRFALLTPPLQITVTVGPTDFILASAVSTDGATGSGSESCSVDSAASSAVCRIGVSLSYDGTSTSTETTVTATGSQFVYGQYPITAGAEKLPSATGACSSATDNAAAPTGLAVRDVYKVLVAPAAAVAAAGIFS